MLPSVLPRLATDSEMRVFPGVWKLLSFWLPSQDGAPSLPLLSLFLSFVFFPTSFWRQWAAFLGAWCPLPAFRSCCVEFTQRLNVLLMNLWGRKWSPRPIPPPSYNRLWEYFLMKDFLRFCFVLFFYKQIWNNLLFYLLVGSLKCFRQLESNSLKCRRRQKMLVLLNIIQWRWQCPALYILSFVVFVFDILFIYLAVLFVPLLRCKRRTSWGSGVRQ